MRADPDLLGELACVTRGSDGAGDWRLHAPIVTHCLSDLSSIAVMAGLDEHQAMADKALQKNQEWLGERLRLEMKRLKVGQQDFADMVGAKSRQAVTGWMVTGRIAKQWIEPIADATTTNPKYWLSPGGERERDADALTSQEARLIKAFRGLLQEEKDVLVKTTERNAEHNLKVFHEFSPTLRGTKAVSDTQVGKRIRPAPAILPKAVKKPVRR